MVDNNNRQPIFSQIIDQIFRGQDAVLNAEQQACKILLLENFRIQDLKLLQMNENQYLGRGAFGRVFKGKYGQTEVAIKQISNNVSKGLAEKELLVLSYLGSQHPKIIHSYGFCYIPTKTGGENNNNSSSSHESEGILHILMELAPLGSLKSIVLDINNTSIVWSIALVLAFARDMAEVLQFLKSKGIKHGDLKCDNFLVFEKLQIKLADFGLAKKHIEKSIQHDSSTSTSNATSSFAGTPAYMPPELWRSIKTDYSADVYALGITIIELITRKSPKRELSICDKINQLFSEVDILLSMEEKTRSNLKELLLQCTALSPTDRPLIENIFEVLSTLLHEVGGDPRSGIADVPIVGAAPKPLVMSTFDIENPVYHQNNTTATPLVPSSSSSQMSDTNFSHHDKKKLQEEMKTILECEGLEATRQYSQRLFRASSILIILEIMLFVMVNVIFQIVQVVACIVFVSILQCVKIRNDKVYTMESPVFKTALQHLTKNSAGTGTSDERDDFILESLRHEIYGRTIYCHKVCSGLVAIGSLIMILMSIG